MITNILKGIDRCVIDHTDGWWETETGATFGREKLVEAQGYECGLLQRITEIESGHPLRVAQAANNEQRVIIAELKAKLADAWKDVWQPIETAPKDDDELILVANNEGVWVAKYHPIYQSGFKPSNPWSSMLLNHDHIRFRSSSIPTHWMPLPKAPAMQPKEQP